MELEINKYDEAIIAGEKIMFGYAKVQGIDIGSIKNKIDELKKSLSDKSDLIDENLGALYFEIDKSYEIIDSD